MFWIIFLSYTLNDVGRVGSVGVVESHQVSYRARRDERRQSIGRLRLAFAHQEQPTKNLSLFSVESLEVFPPR